MEVKLFLEDWAKSPPKLSQLGKPPVNLFLTGSSPRFDVNGNDFRWGTPAAVRSGPANKLEGKLTVYPRSEEGSIDFEVCLSPETLEALSS